MKVRFNCNSSTKYNLISFSGVKSFHRPRVWCVITTTGYSFYVCTFIGGTTWQVSKKIINQATFRRHAFLVLKTVFLLLLICPSCLLASLIFTFVTIYIVLKQFNYTLLIFFHKSFNLSYTSTKLLFILSIFLFRNIE